jgi:hypothetical protein
VTWPSVAEGVAFAVIGATFILYLLVSAPFDSDWRGKDIKAYWDAAMRLREGGEL